MFRPVLLSLCVALPTSAFAQSSTWWDVISPDRLIESFAQGAIIGLRTQVDLTYQDLTVHALGGRVTMTDIRMWPLPDWDEQADCVVSIDRLTFQSAPPTDVENLRLRATAYGVSAPAVCVPPDARQPVEMAGLEELFAPQISVEMDYHVPSSGAMVTATATLANIAAVSLNVDLDYVAFDGREDIDNPEPVVFLNAATLTVDNLGVWDVAKGMIPPPFVTPEQVPNVVGGMLGGAIASMNRDAAGEDAEGDPSALNPAQEEFLQSVVDTYVAFLENPQRLVLETSFPEDDVIYLDFPFFEDNPQAAFADLQPLMTLAPAQARAALPVALIQAALDPEADLSDADRLRVGRALVSGEGAPRHLGRGTDLLVALAKDGNGEAADALSAALELTDPENAYGWGLLAGQGGFVGATSRLDRLERVLDFTRVLEIQAEVNEGVSHSADALDTLASLKVEARARLTGNGAARSYEIASLWARIAAAAGDPEATSILDEIDQRVRAAGPEAREPWAAAEAAAANLALDAWVGRDLATRYGGQ